jgi:hypothetical protein
MFAEKQRLVADLEAYGSGGVPASPAAAAPVAPAPAAPEEPAQVEA